MDVALNAVTVRYPAAGVVHALTDVTVALGVGQRIALVGPSGCGKSTLLGVIGGIEKPSTGQVVVDGVDLFTMPLRERVRLRRQRIGFVFQNDNLLPFLTACENVAFRLSLSQARLPAGRAMELLDSLGLADFSNALPDRLSGGQRQRVAIACALVHQPQLLLADEPTGALDDVTSLTAVHALLDAQTATGATLVVATHNPEVAALMNRTIVLRDGRLIDVPADFTTSIEQ